jgi:RNA polymerase sigma-70 factor (ECF subfamily)
MFGREWLRMTGDPARGAASPEDGEAVSVPLVPDEERLVAEAQRGSIDAFNRLVRLHERQVYNVALRMVGQADAAEDVTQDTFLLAYKSLHQFRGGLFRAWLLRIATNRCYDELRRRQRRPADSFEELAFEPRPQWSTLAPGVEPHERAERLELAQALQRALAQLQDDQRLVVVLSDVQGYSYDEIAVITNVSLGTVKSRLSRGRSRLRDLLRDGPGGGELFGRYRRRNDEGDDMTSRGN